MKRLIGKKKSTFRRFFGRDSKKQAGGNKVRNYCNTLPKNPGACYAPDFVED